MMCEHKKGFFFGVEYSGFNGKNNIEYSVNKTDFITSFTDTVGACASPCFSSFTLLSVSLTHTHTLARGHAHTHTQTDALWNMSVCALTDRKAAKTAGSLWSGELWTLAVFGSVCSSPCEGNPAAVFSSLPQTWHPADRHRRYDTAWYLNRV